MGKCFQSLTIILKVKECVGMQTNFHFVPFFFTFGICIENVRKQRGIQLGLRGAGHGEETLFSML